MNMIWGLLGPEALPSSRRMRSLGLNATVRRFNELAVPGLGGVWFGKQLFLATLGIAVAENARALGARVQNIEVTNAIEALACWLAYEKTRWEPNPRLRGRAKLQGKKGEDFSFAKVKQRGFYVSQPMRIASVRALLPLGLAESSSARFNAYRPTEAGLDLIMASTEHLRTKEKTAVDRLAQWVLGQGSGVTSNTYRQVLSPLEALPSLAQGLLLECLNRSGQESTADTARRSAALRWVQTLDPVKPRPISWGDKPRALSEEHWADLHAGALFFQARDAALTLLDAVEAHIGNLSGKQVLSLSEPMPLFAPFLAALRKHAGDYLNRQHADIEARCFAEECNASSDAQLLRALALRDGLVLRLDGDHIKPGPLFMGASGANARPDSADDTDGSGGSDGTDDAQLTASGQPHFPEGISYRVRNLFHLSRDLQR